MPLLTLARYILELGLMEYDTITLSDSKQAAAALYLAYRMAKYSEWTDSLRYYTGNNFILKKKQCFSRETSNELTNSFFG